jgi:hypothetical protein
MNSGNRNFLELSGPLQVCNGTALPLPFTPISNFMKNGPVEAEMVVKSIYKWKPYATRPKGRPRLRWEDEVRNDLRKIRVKNWKQRVQNRKKWKEIIEQAKTHKE